MPPGLTSIAPRAPRVPSIPIPLELAANEAEDDAPVRRSTMRAVPSPQARSKREPLSRPPVPCEAPKRPHRPPPPPPVPLSQRPTAPSPPTWSQSLSRARVTERASFHPEPEDELTLPYHRYFADRAAERFAAPAEDELTVPYARAMGRP
jgi:hypothetical protein